MTTYPLPTLACTIDASGISAPTYQDILLSLQASYRNIYGAQINLDSDTQDGQWLASLATIINDQNNAAIATYNAYSPSTAQGAGLSSVVKINGIRREASSASTCTVTLIGEANTTINNGQVGDNGNLGTKWALPVSVTIPSSGTIDVIATCTVAGPTQAEAHTLTVILTPTLGWQTVDNANAATPGATIETDAALRQRQSISTGKPAQTPLESVLANVENVAGVTQTIIYENVGDTTDSNGIPSHSISVVVLGGATQDIIDAIGATKTPGTGSYGTTSGTYVDPSGVNQLVSFFRLAQQRVIVTVTIHALEGWSTSTITSIQQAVADYINSLPIGENVYLTKTIAAACLYNSALGNTFNVTAVVQGIFPASPSAADVVISFNESAICSPSDVTVTVL